MTYETAEHIVKRLPHHQATLALVRLVAAKVYPDPADQTIVADLVLSAVACAYSEGYKHRDGLQ